MKKTRKKYCWDAIQSWLWGAKETIEKLRARILYCETGEFPEEMKLEEWIKKRWQKTTEEDIFIYMEQIYYMLNIAWNCRTYTERRARVLSERDTSKCEKFPKDWPELWSSVSRIPRETRTMSNGKVCYFTMRILLEEVLKVLDDVINDIVVTYNLWHWEEYLALKPRSTTRTLRGQSPVDEVELGIQMRHLYLLMNEAWNTRKLTITEKSERSVTTVRRHLKFPYAFKNCWPIDLI